MFVGLAPVEDMLSVLAQAFGGGSSADIAHAANTLPAIIHGMIKWFFSWLLRIGQQGKAGESGHTHEAFHAAQNKKITNYEGGIYYRSLMIADQYHSCKYYSCH
jgi:hypothetical protein